MDPFTRSAMARDQIGPEDQDCLAWLRTGDRAAFQTVVRPLLPSLLAGPFSHAQFAVAAQLCRRRRLTF